MARDGNGNFTMPYPNFVSGTVISSTEVDANNSDVSTALTGSLPRDGQAAPTGNIPFGSYKITGLGSGSALTDSITLGQTQNQAYLWCSTGGTADAITLTPTPSITAYAAGQTFRFIASADNTSTVTIEVSGLTAKDLKKTVSAAAADLVAGDLKEGGVYQITYDGTQFRLYDVTGNIIANVTGNLTGNASGTALNVTGTVLVANGGTGLTTLTANNLMVGNGTGNVTFIAPSTSGNVLTSNGTTWESAAPSDIPVKAWVKFNGADGSIQASSGVSGVVRNGAGDYTISFSSSFADTKYATVGSSNRGGGFASVSYSNQTTSAVDVYVYSDTTTKADPTDVSVHITR